MNLHRLRLLSLLPAGILLGFCPASAGIVRFNATINAAQEPNNSSTSTATGTAVMLYDVTADRFDLTITLTGFPGPLTASHIHEAAVGVNGSIRVDLGAGETNYTRVGNTLTATFSNLSYTTSAPGGGTVATLLSGGSYVNFHTAAFPGGEIRGQLIPEPVHLTATMNAANEIGAHTPVNSTAYGAAQAVYNPVTNQITTLVCVYNFTNTLTASHIHEAAVTASGPIRRDFGAAAAYVNSGTSYVQLFSNQTYGGTAALLLSEGAYVNVHSNIYGPGEIRGQLYVVNPSNAGRLVNVSSRGQIGTGANVLINGFFVQGLEPARVLVTGRGPSFASGVSGTIVDPVINVYDTSGRLLFANDNFATAPFQALITAFSAVSFTAAEAGALLVLPPGGYTIVVSGAGNTTGIGIGEAFEVSW